MWEWQVIVLLSVGGWEYTLLIPLSSGNDILNELNIGKDCAIF